MNIRKLFAVMLAAMLTLVCFTGCGKQDVSGIAKTVWGLSPEDAVAAFDLSGETPTVHQTEGNISEVVYEYADVTLLGQKCHITLSFTAPRDAAPGLNNYTCAFDSQNKADAFYDALMKDADAVTIDGTAGIGGADMLTKEQLDWLQNNSIYAGGENGIRVAMTGIFQSAKDVQENGYQDEEVPAILVKKSSAQTEKQTFYYVRVDGTILNMLSQREAYEQLHRELSE